MINEVTGQPLTPADIAYINALDVPAEHGADVERDVLAQARIVARYYQTLIAGEVPHELARALTINFHDTRVEHRFWLRANPGKEA